MTRRFRPVKRCTACGQKEGRWEDVTDMLTGTAYMKCRNCGAFFKASAAGWVDWRMGVCMSDMSHVGSDWTQKAAKRYFGRPSDVTDK